jgi:hypothetical protein
MVVDGYAGDCGAAGLGTVTAGAVDVGAETIAINPTIANRRCRAGLSASLLSSLSTPPIYCRKRARQAIVANDVAEALPLERHSHAIATTGFSLFTHAKVTDRSEHASLDAGDSRQCIVP